MRVGLISDSHGQWPADLDVRLEGCETILHMGDLGPLRLLAELSAMVAPIQAVMGNTDSPGQPELPAHRKLTLEGLPLHLRHMPWSPFELNGEAGLYLHGHIHRPLLERHGQAWICCPGALTHPRGSEASYGLLELEPESIGIVIHAVADGRRLLGQTWPRV